MSALSAPVFFLMIAFAVLGFAVLHMITRGTGSRPFMLGGIYAAVLVFGWPVLIMSLLGLADSAFNLRGRVAAKRTNSSNRP